MRRIILIWQNPAIYIGVVFKPKSKIITRVVGRDSQNIVFYYSILEEEKKESIPKELYFTYEQNPSLELKLISV